MSELKIVKHQLWPVSYVNDDGEQVDAIYTFNPRAAGGYFVGEAFFVETLHPTDMSETHRQAKIDEMKAQIAKLEAFSHG